MPLPPPSPPYVLDAHSYRHVQRIKNKPLAHVSVTVHTHTHTHTHTLHPRFAIRRTITLSHATPPAVVMAAEREREILMV